MIRVFFFFVVVLFSSAVFAAPPGPMNYADVEVFCPRSENGGENVFGSFSPLVTFPGHKDWYFKIYFSFSYRDTPISVYPNHWQWTYGATYCVYVCADHFGIHSMNINAGCSVRQDKTSGEYSYYFSSGPSTPLGSIVDIYSGGDASLVRHDLQYAGDAVQMVLESPGALAAKGLESWRPILEKLSAALVATYSINSPYVNPNNPAYAEFLRLVRLSVEGSGADFVFSSDRALGLKEMSRRSFSAGLRQAGVDGISTGSWSYAKPTWGKPLPTISDSVLHSRAGDFPEIEDSQHYTSVVIPVFGGSYTFSLSSFCDFWDSETKDKWRLLFRSFVFAGVSVCGLVWVFRTLREL